MKTLISLLRGVNVSRQNRINMLGLKRLYGSLDLVNVVTYIQSGNVVFDTGENDPTKISRSIEEAITRSFGGEVRVILRDKDSTNKILGSNPFLNQRNADPENLYVTFLSDTPSELDLKEKISPPPDPRTPSTPRGVETADGGLMPPRLGAGEIINLGSWRKDEFIIHGKEVYLFCPNGYGKTKFSNTFFEKKLSVSATTRNWKTVNALCEIANQR